MEVIMAIFNTLKKDHNQIKTLLVSLEKDPANKGLFTQFVHTLMTHNILEEKAFYWPLERKSGSYHIIAEASEQEHNLVNEMINHIETSDFKPSECAAFIAILKRMVEAHILKEEENIFPLVKEIFSKNELQSMEAIFNEEKANFDITTIKPHIQIKATRDQDAKEIAEEATRTVVLEQEDG
jgi:hemerythrin superfamily protein